MEEAKAGQTQREELPLSKAAEHLLEECRMVLPGIQMLFGFQLIVVFNPGFDQKLTSAEQHVHLLAIVLVTIAAAVIMTPAVYHRQKPREVTDEFINVSRRLLLWSMVPLSLGITLDFYLIARVILGAMFGSLIAGALFAAFVTLWFIFPRVRALRRFVVGGT
jgi:hypothetical protein